MNLRNLEMHVVGNEFRRLAKALDALPDGTVGDISSRDDIVVREGTWYGKEGVVEIISSCNETKGLDLTVPKEASYFNSSSKNGSPMHAVYFKYKEFCYYVEPIESYKIAEE